MDISKIETERGLSVYQNTLLNIQTAAERGGVPMGIQCPDYTTCAYIRGMVDAGLFNERTARVFEQDVCKSAFPLCDLQIGVNRDWEIKNIGLRDSRGVN